MVFDHFFHCHLLQIFGCSMHHMLEDPCILQVFDVSDKLLIWTIVARSLSFSCTWDGTHPPLGFLEILNQSFLLISSMQVCKPLAQHCASNLKKSKLGVALCFTWSKKLFTFLLHKNCITWCLGTLWACWSHSNWPIHIPRWCTCSKCSQRSHFVM
jgi:hypothetical protein